MDWFNRVLFRREISANCGTSHDGGEHCCKTGPRNATACKKFWKTPQCQNRQRAERCVRNVGTSDAGGATGKQAQYGRGSRLGAGILAPENSSDCGSPGGT